MSYTLKSNLLNNNSRLRSCLSSDKDHIIIGCAGDYVGLIQTTLTIIDNASIDISELKSMYYGASTAEAVQLYKADRGIINHTYQNTADNIVGKMTIEAMDKEMISKESYWLSSGGFAAPFLRSLLFAPKLKGPKVVIVSEVNEPWISWARQMKQAYAGQQAGKENKVHIVEMGNGETVSSASQKLKSAAMLAGPGGMLIFSVGHGGAPLINNSAGQWGIFDMAPNHVFQLGGRDCWYVGIDEPKGNKERDGRERSYPSATGAFYADRPPMDGGFIMYSKRETDLGDQSEFAKTRLKNWDSYQDVSNSFANLGSILLLTCRVGNANGFLLRLKQQWNTKIIGYKRRVLGQAIDGKVRVFLEGDREGQGTNTAFATMMFPLSMDSIII